MHCFLWGTKLADGARAFVLSAEVFREKLMYEAEKSRKYYL